MVRVNISHSYFHLGGAHITWVKIISHTGTTSPMPSHKGSNEARVTVRDPSTPFLSEFSDIQHYNG